MSSALLLRQDSAISDFAQTNPVGKNSADIKHFGVLPEIYSSTGELPNLADNVQLDTASVDIKPPPTFTLRKTSIDEGRSVTVVDVLAEWNGCVTSVNSSGHDFSATLKGMIGNGVKGEEEEAVIPISDVSDWDMDLLRPGNFFRLSVIHEILATGQPRRYTQVVFRRLPAYRQHDLDLANERGRMLAQQLRVE